MTDAITTSVPVNMSSGVSTPAANGGDSGSSSVPSFLDSIGADLASKTWAQDFSKADKPYEALAKAYEGAQTQIGKKSLFEVPGENATPEEWREFHKKLGAPEKADGYEYKMPDLSKEPEGLQKLMTDMRDEGFTNKMRQAAYDAGLTPKQFAAMANALDSHTVEQGRAAHERAATAQQEFEAAQAKNVSAIYGDSAEAVKGVAKEVYAKILPDAVRNTKDAEIMLLEAAKYIHEKVFKNDTVMKAGSQNSSHESLREQIMEARKHEAFTDWKHPLHDEQKARVAQLYAMEAELKRNK